MNIIQTELDGVLLVEPDVYGDQRGYFMETYSRKRYSYYNIMAEFIQDNLSFSGKGILRGLHYQLNYPQAKLVQVLKGEVFDVAVDIRVGSKTFGQWYGACLSECNRRQLYIPGGFAHGFCVTGDGALFHYKCSDYYHPEDEHGILWSDNGLNITWPCSDPVLSEKDQAYDMLKNIHLDCLPAYRP